MVGVRGFEPPTTGTPCRCATRLRYTPKARNDTENSVGIESALAPEKLQQVFQFHPHLANDLLALIDVFLSLFTG